MEQVGNFDKRIIVLTARGEKAESVAAAAQDKSLPSAVKSPVLEAFKGSMDAKTILNFVY